LGSSLTGQLNLDRTKVNLAGDDWAFTP
jgi:hypothetical protein